MGTVSEILKLLINESGVSENELSRRMNITAATLNKLKTGIMSNPTLNTLNTIAQYFGVSIDQLTGEAPLDTFFSRNLRCVPFLTDSQFNTDVSDLNFSNHLDWKRIELDHDITSSNIFAISVSGEAMFPFLDNQTIAIVDKDETPSNKSLVLAYINSTKEYLIRKLLMDGSFKILKPINPSFPEIKLGVDDKVIGTVISTIKNYK